MTSACAGYNPCFIRVVLGCPVDITEDGQEMVELVLGQPGQGFHLAIVSDVQSHRQAPSRVFEGSLPHSLLGNNSIAGKSILAFRRGEVQPTPSIKCFAFVQTYDEKPKRRLFELLQSQGLQMNQQIEFLSDGGDTVRDVQLYLSPEADHLLDWFHLTMRLTTMTQSAKGLPDTMGEEETVPLRDEVVRQLERSKWFLWHGNVFRAMNVLTSILCDLEMASFEREDGKITKVCKMVREFHTFIDRNRAFIPNYEERYRNGERISTGFVESTVNQVVSRRMVKKQ